MVTGAMVKTKINLIEKIIKFSTNCVVARKNTHDEKKIYDTKPRKRAYTIHAGITASLQSQLQVRSRSPHR